MGANFIEEASKHGINYDIMKEMDIFKPLTSEFTEAQLKMQSVQ